MFRDALHKGWIQPQQMRDWIRTSAAAPPQPLHELGERELLRALISNVRGVGYRLCLPATAVVLS